MNNVILNGNALQIPLADESVQCVVTSPPYWGLRDYGIGGQLGLEPTPEEYVANMVRVFREVRRVLRPSGVVWINLGDSYSSGFSGQAGQNESSTMESPNRGAIHAGRRAPYKGLPPKNLVGIPWRTAFALQADGWWLRSDIIWHKPNAMPESVTDRPTKAHEYVFLLSKSARYFYDAEAVKESANPKYQTRYNYEFHADGTKESCGAGRPNNESNTAGMKAYTGKRNRRTVWTIPTHPYSGAHFATFPPKLVEPCILAGTSAKGECPVCGLAWVRVIERTGHKNKREPAHAPNNCPTKTDSTGWAPTTRATDTWRPQCDHDAEPIPQLVLDPFAGTATVGQVAIKHRRRFVGVELNGKYIEMARERTSGVQVALL